MLGDIYMNKKPFSNDDLDSFLKGGLTESKKPTKPWEGLDPNAKRTGNRSFTIQLNDYEWALIEEAAKADSSSKAALIRRSTIRHCRTILELY